MFERNVRKQYCRRRIFKVKYSIGTLITLLKIYENAGFWTESYPYFLAYGKMPIYGKIQIQFCTFTGNMDQREPTFRRHATQRFLYKTFDQNQLVCKKSAGYIEVYAIKEVHYREVLPCDKFIIY